ncbi:MAG: tyrosine--tRNA ligase [Bacteroidota bacterium]
MEITFIKELQQRGMLHTITPKIEETLINTTKAYVGIDPTAPSLHIGNLATLMLLRHFQLKGHRPILVLGGATGMIGDPSFKATERKLLDEEILRHHEACLAKQLRGLLDFSGQYAAILLNNYDWLKKINTLHFLRDTGKYISVNYMMSKDSVKNRMRTGISYTEFAYQLLQAYDFYHLYKEHDVKIQMGGADQWGNITTGIELIRKRLHASVHGLTTPLITKADGTKFGKTEQGNIWLDPTMTSPYHFYQFWLNCSDEEAVILMKRLTLEPLDAIQELIDSHRQYPHQRILQKRVAQHITCLVHSQATYQKVVKASTILFGNTSPKELGQLSKDELLDLLAEVPHIRIPSEKFTHINSLTELLSTATDGVVCTSKREARELIQSGSIRINKMQYRNLSTLPTLTFLQGNYLLVQRGKKHYYLIERIP